MKFHDRTDIKYLVISYFQLPHTVYPHIVAVETFLKIQIAAANFWFLPNRLNYCCGNYSREDTIRGWKMYEDIRYILLLLPEDCGLLDNSLENLYHHPQKDSITFLQP